jgi:hypothetical protein
MKEMGVFEKRLGPGEGHSKNQLDSTTVDE